MSCTRVELHRLNRLYHASSRVSQAMVLPPSEEKTAPQICQRLVSDGGFVLAWIGRQEPQTGAIVPLCWSGLTAFDVEQIKLLAHAGADNRRMAQAALTGAKTVVCNDFPAHSLALPCGPLAKNAGIAAAAAFPIQCGDGVAGVLCLYSSELHFFGGREISLLEEVAENISSGLRHLEQEARQKAQLDSERSAKDFTAVKQAEDKLAEMHAQLVEASRVAGMAEVATSILHNVGNVLNSVNVSCSVVSDKIRDSRIGNVTKLAALLNDHAADLPAFLSSPKGRQLPAYLSELATHLAAERDQILLELQSLASNIDHIKEIVASQQSYARTAGLVESVLLPDLVEDALAMHKGALGRHSVKVFREYNDTPPLLVDKHKVLQILINLLHNSKYAVDEGAPPEKRVTVRIEKNGGNTVRVSVIDNGVGIPKEHLSRIFEHGFTTRKGGHGFGLHSGALTARELGGTLTAYSDGLGRGAKFVLELPVEPRKTTL
ncbi:MAG: ATP-binding protein [Verrucomicrobiota bacterium]